MLNDLLAEIATLHQTATRDQPPAIGEQQRHAAIALAGLQRVTLELIQQRIAPTLLETALFYQCLRFATLNHGHDDDVFAVVSSDLHGVMGQLVNTLKTLNAELQDAGPTPTLGALGDKVQQLRDAYADQLPPAAPQGADLERQVANTN